MSGTYRPQSARKTRSPRIDDSPISSRQSMRQTSRVSQKRTYDNNFAARYFNENPDRVPDKSPPGDKIKSIRRDLEDPMINDNDKFNSLIRLKALTTLHYGENSPQMVDMLIELSTFYNEQNRPESALRNLKKAETITQNLELDEETLLKLAVEISTAYLDAKAESPSEKSRHVRQATASIKPFMETPTSDEYLKYKRNLVLSRIEARRDNYENAVRSYNQTVSSLKAARGKCPELANLYQEMAVLAREKEDEDGTRKYAQKAYDIFNDLLMPESAQAVRNDFPEYLNSEDLTEAFSED